MMEFSTADSTAFIDCIQDLLLGLLSMSESAKNNRSQVNVAWDYWCNRMAGKKITKPCNVVKKIDRV